MKRFLEFNMFWVIFVGQTLLLGLVFSIDPSYSGKGFLNIERGGDLLATARPVVMLASFCQFLYFLAEKILGEIKNGKE